jgi:hypothetical protein
MGLAVWCQHGLKNHHAAVARWYAEAFAAAPTLAGNEPSAFRYNAACAAALAGSGQGDEATPLGDEQRAHLRRQALDWLRAELAAWRRRLEKVPPGARLDVVRQMQTWQPWQRDTDFAGVRSPEALSALPQAEAADWQKLWEDVDKLQRAAGPTRLAGSGHP